MPEIIFDCKLEDESSSPEDVTSLLNAREIVEVFDHYLARSRVTE